MPLPGRGLVFVDGVAHPPAGARVSVYDRGFLYGDSVFEALRTYRGRLFGLEEHVARLHRSAARLAMDLPWSEPALVDEIANGVKTAGFPESYVRVVVTRGSGPIGLDIDLAETPTRVTIIQPLTLPPPEVYRAGVGVRVVTARRATDGTPAAGAKASNYLANLLALREAKAAGCFEPLFVAPRLGLERSEALVLEGGTSNVFAVFAAATGEKPILATPPEERVLGGITRRHVLEVAPEAGFQVWVTHLPLRTLYTATEVFLTSSIRELVPVGRVVDDDGIHTIGHTTGHAQPGPAVRAIHLAFRQHVGAPTSPMPWELA